MIENNGYSMGTSQKRSSAYNGCLAQRAEAYAIEWDVVDGSDIYEVRAKTNIAMERARKEHKPTVLEIDTYRYYGHSVADANFKKYPDSGGNPELQGQPRSHQRLPQQTAGRRRPDRGVEVAFANGSISETFPHSHGGKVTVEPGARSVSYGGKWTGRLHPPTDGKAAAEIPVIETAENEEPYGAAREVPDAWIFESGLEEIPGLKVQPHFPQVEKFIFYRGAGNAYIPVTTSVEGDSVTVKNEWGHALPFGVALRVRNGKASWVEVPAVAGKPVENAPAMNQVRVKFPEPDRSIDEVESELAALWKKALAEHGLTTAEASAMVETWRKTWFRESGDRFLALVPQEPVDAMLPLKITPAPEEVTRVFVARFEMISDEMAARLVTLLNDSEAVDEGKFARFQSMELGRFGQGAMDIAVDIKKWEMITNFHALKAYGESIKTSGR